MKGLTKFSPNYKGYEWLAGFMVIVGTALSIFLTVIFILMWVNTNKIVDNTNKIVKEDY